MKRLTILLLSLLALAACHEDDSGGSPVAPTGMTVSVLGDTLLSRNAAYESITLSVGGLSDADSILRVTTDADWLVLRTDTLPSDGIVAIQTTTNNGASRRQATLTVASAAEPTHRASLTLTQLSEADNDQNGSNARHVLYIGYGYNIYQSLDDTLAVRTTEPILKYADLINSGGTDTYEVLHDAHLARTEIKYVASKTIHGFAENLTQQQTANTLNIPGCRANCLTVERNIRTGSLFEQNFGKYESTARDGKEFHEMKKGFVHRFGGGESMLQLAQRIYNLLDDLKAQPDKTFILVAHNGIARVVQSYFYEMTNDEFASFGIKNCEVREYEF